MQAHRGPSSWEQKRELQSWLEEKEGLVTYMLQGGNKKEAKKLQKTIDKCQTGRHGDQHAFMSGHREWSCNQFAAHGAAGNLDQREDLEAALEARHRYEKQQASDAALAEYGDELAGQAKEVAGRACSAGKCTHASF